MSATSSRVTLSPDASRVFKNQRDEQQSRRHNEFNRWKTEKEKKLSSLTNEVLKKIQLYYLIIIIILYQSVKGIFWDVRIVKKKKRLNQHYCHQRETMQTAQMKSNYHTAHLLNSVHILSVLPTL